MIRGDEIYFMVKMVLLSWIHYVLPMAVSAIICPDCSFYLLKPIFFCFPEFPYSSLRNISSFIFGSLWPYRFSLIPCLIPFWFYCQASFFSHHHSLSPSIFAFPTPCRCTCSAVLSPGGMLLDCYQY